MGRRKQPYRTGGPSQDKTRHNSPYWCKYTELIDGKEVNRVKWFPSRAAAESHGQLMIKHHATRPLTDQERLIALHIIQECAARGLSPLEVHAAGLKHFGVEPVKEIEIEEAVELFCIWMTGEKYSSITIKSYEGSLNWLIRQTDPHRHVSSYTSKELVLSVRGRYENYTSQKAFLRDLKSFFSWAARQGYCSKEIAAEALLNPGKTKSSVRKSAARRTHERPPRLTPDQVKTIFKAVDSRYHPALALAVFAGLRPQSEIPNVLYRHEENGHTYGVDFDHKRIDLPSHWVKKTFMARQLTDLPEPLWRILEYHRKEEGKVSPLNYTNFRKFVLNSARDALGLDRWHTDLARHTALSFIATLRGREIAMNAAGHLNSRTFTRHYLNSVGSAEADQFNNLFPNYPSLD